MLIHPTHRKFIKKLRQRVDEKGPIIILESDYEDYKALLARTKKALERHKGIYRILNKAMTRNNTDYDEEFVSTIGYDAIDLIEKTLNKAEWKRPFRTIRNVILKPIILYLLKQLKKFK